MAVGGKGGSSSGPSPEVEQGLLNNSNALTSIAQSQNANAQQLYGLTEPGLGTAEQFYKTLASGDPTAIMQTISPAAQQSSQAAAGAVKNIQQNMPGGGEKNLALENVELQKQGQVASTATNAFLGAPNALGQLAGQGIGESISSAGTGISGLSAGTQSLSSLGGMQLQEQQIQAEQKGNTLGAVGGLAGSAMGAAGAAGGFGALFGGGAAADAGATALMFI